MREVLKGMRKEFLYDSYERIVDNPKDYTKITRYKMHEEALEVLSKDPYKLKDSLRLLELDDMLRIAHESNENGEYFTGDSFFDYPSGMILFGFESFDEENGIFTMEPNIREYFKNFEYSDYEEELIYFLFVVEGMVETYGIIKYEDIEDIYAKQRKSKYRKYQPMTIRDNEVVGQHLFSKHHSLYLDAIVHNSIEEEYIHNYFTPHRELYSLDYYYNMGKYRLPLENTDEFTDLIRDELSLIRIGYLNSLIQINPENTTILEELNILGDVESSVLELFKNIVLNTPIWKYGGLSVLDYEMPDASMLDEDIQSDYLTFIEKFIEFGNQKYRLYPKNKKLSDEEAFHVLKHTIGRKNIVDNYSKSRYYPKVDRAEEFKLGLDNAIEIEMGYAFGYKDGKLLVFKEGFIFEVTGITHPIEDILSSNYLPVMVNIVLIPLIDNITYGVSMQSMPALQLGSNITNIFDKEIKQATTIESIIDVHQHRRSIENIND